MKSFKKLMSEVAQPKAEDEIDFKDKHEIEVYDCTKSSDVTHRSSKRRATRLADYEKGEDEDVYESKVIYKTSADDRDELDDVFHDIKQKYPKNKITTTKNKAIGGWDIEVLDETLDESVKFNGLTFNDYKTFDSEREANKFLEKNDDYGVIGEKGGKVYVARMDDMGEEAINEDATMDKIVAMLTKRGDGTKVVKDKAGYFHIKGNKGRNQWHVGPFNDLDDVLRGLQDLDEAKLDPVNKKAISKDFDNRKDKDIDNDGDVDDSDEYLHKRRKAISKAMEKDKKEESSLHEAKWELTPAVYMVGGNLSYDDKVEFKLDKKNSDILNRYFDQADDKEKLALWKMFWNSKETRSGTPKGPLAAIEFAKKALKESFDLDEAKGMSVGGHAWKSAMNKPFVVRAKIRNVSNEKFGQFETEKEARDAIKKNNLVNARIIHAVSGKEIKTVNEAKMTDSEVLSAAKSLAKNGKDEKTKKFGQGLVDYYNEHDSFTPAQVGGLQNIMKNAGFQFAKESASVSPKGSKPATSYDSYEDYVADRKKERLQVLPKALWQNLKKDESAAEFITKAASAKKKDKKTFDMDGEEFPVTIKDKNADKIVEAKGDMAEIGRKLQKMAPKEKNDMISNAMANIADHLESFGTPFGAKSIKDLEKRTGLTSNIIRMVINKADATASVSESSTDNKKDLHNLMLKALGKKRLPRGHSYKSSIANNGDFIVQDGSGRIVGRISKGEFENPLKENNITEKSTSRAQQKLMGMALAYKRGEMDDASEKVKEIADGMTKKDLEDFAKTKHENLPDKMEESEIAGWVAFYNGKKLEIPKDQAKDLYGAKMYAAKELRVPKSKMGLLAIKPAYNESFELSEIASVRKMTDSQLKNWLKKNDTDEPDISPTFGRQLLDARKEMKRRGLKIESFELDEAFTKGSLSLDDGSSVKLDKKDANLLNQMFDDLNSKNKREMMKIAMKDEVGFEEIIGFAREAL